MIKKQRTIKKIIDFSGIGLHTGVETNMSFLPAKENEGIVFLYVDEERPEYNVSIKASIDNVIETNRGTTIAWEGHRIYTVEHVLSALYALNIDNLLIQINNCEPPIFDGSSICFIDEILKVGTHELSAKREYLKITETINYYDEKSDISLSIKPSDTFKISFECDFSFGDIGKQKYHLNSLDEYVDQIARARTFCSSDELLYLKENNLINGATLDSGIVFINKSKKIDIEKIKDSLGIELKKTDKKGKLLNNKKLRYEDEPVRHKILDLIGDISLIGKPIIGHIISYKSGHRTNIEFAKKIKMLDSNFKFNRRQIMDVIPHRDPFLLIDEVIGGIPGKKVIAVKDVSPDDYFFKGHFPDKPIMPGVLILECMAQTSCFLSFNTVNNRTEKMMLLSVVNSSKFIKKVVPGDKLFIEVELLKFRLNTASIRGIAKVDEQIVSKAEFMATVVDKNV